MVLLSITVNRLKLDTIIHVDFMQIRDCRILRLLPHFQQSAHIAYFFCINWHFDDILILSVFLLPISIRFRYLERLVANRVAPSTCPDPVERDGVVGFKPLSTIAYFRRIFGIYAVHIFLLKCRIKKTCLTIEYTR